MPPKKHICPYHNYTLIELLVVVAIISLLASLLLPALYRAKEQAYKAACISNQKQVGLALSLYQADYRHYIPSHTSGQTEYWYRWFDGPHSNPPGLGPDEYSGEDAMEKGSILRCSKNKVANNSTYGVAMSGSSYTEDNDFFVRRSWDGMDTGLFSAYRVSHMPYPAEWMYLGCTSKGNNGSKSNWRTTGTVKWGTSSLAHSPANTARGLWLTHLKQVNGLFPDGHAEPLAPSELLQTRNAYISDANRGIHAWKEEDGTYTILP